MIYQPPVAYGAPRKLSLWTRFLAAWGQRRRYQEMLALDDRILADIGLHRSQIPALLLID
jgi:uncharacterized protein YjiS (DUF1127 family)